MVIQGGIDQIRQENTEPPFDVDVISFVSPLALFRRAPVPIGPIQPTLKLKGYS